MLNFVPDAKGYIDVGRAMWSKIYIIQVNVVRFYVLDDVEQQNNLYHGDPHCHLNLNCLINSWQSCSTLIITTHCTD